MAERKEIWNKIISRWPIIFGMTFLAIMLIALLLMFRSPTQGLAKDGRVDLTAEHFAEKHWVALDGYWQLYWGRLLSPQDFSNGDGPPPDFLVKVQAAGTTGGLAPALLPITALPPTACLFPILPN